MTVHESPLARQILRAVLERAGAAGVERVRRVHGWIAECESLSPDSIACHFAALAAGTPAEGAVLDLRLVQVQARCERCGAGYRPMRPLFLCPECGSGAATLLGPTGIGIDAIEAETP